MFTNYVVVGSSPVAVSETSDIVAISRKEFHEIHANKLCRFTLKLLGVMIRTYSQVHRTDKSSQFSSIIPQV